MNLYKSFAFILCAIAIESCGGGSDGNISPASSDSTLSNLTVSAGVLSPVFQSGIEFYTLLVPNDVAEITVIPTVNQANATVLLKVNNVAVSSSAISAAIPLLVGTTFLEAQVTAQDSTTRTYGIDITREAAVETRALLDPTPGTGDHFGSLVTVLGNGNIVVSDPNDSSRFVDNGAVHLYSPFSSVPIASLYGNAGGDRLGSSSITLLGNNNYVIASEYDNENGIVRAGSVRLMNGSTGKQIGATITGDVEDDLLGSRSITALPNNNYVISSTYDDENGIVNAGSVRLVNGNTGEQIGSSLAGDVADDQLGSRIITLENNNYVIASTSDDENGIANAGSVRLINGSTGVQIGATLAGDVTSDYLGSNSITVLANNNYVIASSSDNENGIVNAGSVRLVNGNTGEQIGSSLAGDVADDQLGRSSITALANNNYIIASEFDDENGIVNAGSVRLMNGNTGVQIGATLAGDVAYDRLGSSSITALANNNYVIASSSDDENGIVNAGSVSLINGSTGVQIGATIVGDNTSDFLGSSSITALENNNYVVASENDNENGIVGAGSVRLINGSTGVQIGATLAGDVEFDQLGSGGITVLANNNYVIASENDNENGIDRAGSIRLVNGSTGVQIGSSLTGDITYDQLGYSGITALANNNFLIATSEDDENGVVDAGSVRLVDGSTGLQLGNTLTGEFIGGLPVIHVYKPFSGNYYILSAPYSDYLSLSQSGVVSIIAP
jgi:hypothetical protein